MPYVEFHRWILAAVLAMARIGGAFAVCATPERDVAAASPVGISFAARASNEKTSVGKSA